MRYHRIPDETVRRLPLYLRGVLTLAEQGRKNVSSRHLADFLGTNPWQIRKDFSYFGDFGIPGVGYDAERLSAQIKKILKLNSGHNAALIGVGNIGSALLAYGGFERYGFKIAAAFDNDPKKIGKKKNDIIIEDTSKIASLSKRNVDLGIIATPWQFAQETADCLVRAGVKGILNFTPHHIAVPKKIKVISIDIAMDLARLPYYMPA